MQLSRFKGVDGSRHRGPVSQFDEIPDSEPLNVAFIIDKFNVGGTQRQLITLANRLASLHIGAVTMLCLQYPGPLATELAGNIKVLSLGLKRIYGISALRQLWRTRALLRSSGCDVIHAFLPSANIFASLLRPLTRLPVIASRRDIGIYPGKLWQKLEEMLAYRLVDTVICVSQEVRAILLSREPALRAKTLVITNAIDLDAIAPFTPRPSAPPDSYIACVGNIKPVKAYDFLLDAATDIDGRIIVVGAGDGLEGLRAATRDRGLDRKLEFVGHKDPEEIVAILQGAIFAVHPSFSEGASNAILEFMAHGLAVICRNIPGNAELVSHGTTGLLFSDRAEFVGHVNQLLHDTNLRQAMGMAARHHVETSHSVDRIMADYLRLYRRLRRNRPTCSTIEG
jgi:L-malate glycosyltransferase